MKDVADGLIPDVRGIVIDDLDFVDAECALNRALRRIVTPRSECEFQAFNSSI